jgi:hypothetical protein
MNAVKNKKAEEIDLDYIPIYVKKKLVAYGKTEL